MLARVREPMPLGTDGPPAPEVVGIGASAGGLEALRGLLSQLKPNGRTAYVVAQHMASDSHHDLMRQLLQRTCVLPVRLMVPGEAPVPDAVTLIPSGKHAVWQAGRWVQQPPSSDHFSTPSVDVLLASLGEGLGSAAAGVILSGAGSDGARGAAALRALGGRIWIQTLAQAGFDGMPSAALQAVPDAVVARVEHMAGHWLGMPMPADVVGVDAPALEVLIAQVRLATGIDFSGYKPETLLRRAARRQAELGLASLEDYAAHLTQQPQEAQVLQRRFLVSVSSFFRERDAFEALGRAWRLDKASDPAPRRCWVPACATGEEAYTLAMLHAEGQRDGAWARGLDVLGTDLDDGALTHARQAVYGEKALREVSADMRQRYFAPQGGSLQVKRPIREAVRFEKQDLLAVMPEGPWDVISCRNLLIYLQTHLQERLIAGFHERLAPGGWLFLSPSETLPQASLRWFAPFDMNHRIYRRLH